MRGLQRLRGSTSALSTCSIPSMRTVPAASLLKTDVATQSLSKLSARRTQNWGASSQFQRRCLATSAPRLEKGTIVPVEEHTASEVASEEDLFLDAESEESWTIQTDLVYPDRIVKAERREDITDAEYVPADKAEGLEEVGGLEGWWDRPEHWGASKQYVGFGPLEKVTDRVVLDVLTKRAVVEALVLKRFSRNKVDPPAALTLTHGEEELLSVVGIEVVAGPDGAVTLKNEEDYQRVWENLSRAQAEDVHEIPHPAEPEISAEKARELVKTWDPSWKTLQLRDPVLKFYIAKRLQRLTGHRIPDGKLMGIETVRSLVSYLAQPPKAKKLAEELKTTGILSDLPNVKVVPRRVTPVDKEKEVGRWKIIEQELKKRGLPVFGTAGYRKAFEKSWISGGV